MRQELLLEDVPQEALQKASPEWRNQTNKMHVDERRSRSEPFKREFVDDRLSERIRLRRRLG